MACVSLGGKKKKKKKGKNFATGTRMPESKTDLEKGDLSRANFPVFTCVNRDPSLSPSPWNDHETRGYKVIPYGRRGREK